MLLHYILALQIFSLLLASSPLIDVENGSNYMKMCFILFISSIVSRLNAASSQSIRPLLIATRHSAHLKLHWQALSLLSS